ncbi:MAG TPA: hypothetical protein VFA18_20720 [Gemmataceae bacterium]|nr:hypothetical protein [Gemmataceae bacterium]
MIKRQRRILRISAVLQEYLAAKTASDLLTAQTKANPSYGLQQGWDPRAGVAFTDNLEATYIIRIYAEFEAALRDYWLTYRGRATRPKMYQLVNQAIPDQAFSQDVIDNADDVRQFRNFLVHDIEDEPGENIVTFTVPEAKSHLCAYLGRLDPAWS